MSTFALEREVLGSDVSHAISEAAYRKIATAAHLIFNARALEDIFNDLIENYIEFEQEVVGIAVRASIVNEPPGRLADHMQSLSRRLSNLLASTRSYRDQGNEFTRRISLELEKQFNALRDEQANQRFGYRLMEAVRDHSQHVSQTVHGITLERNHTDDGMQVGLRIRISRAAILANVKLKRPIRRELELHSCEAYELRPAIREHMAGLCADQEALRNGYRLSVEASIATIQEACDEFIRARPDQGKVFGLYAVDRSCGEVRTAYVSTEAATRLTELQSVNSRFINLEKRYATGRARFEVFIPDAIVKSA